MELTQLSIREAHELLSTKKISSVELTQAMLDRIHEVDKKVQSYVTVTDDLAIEQAKKADERIAKGGNVTPLTGIPFSMKDCISTRNVLTTCSSKILENYIPQYNATVTNKLADSGAVLVGKTNMDEFGMGSSTENSSLFPTRNPWDLEHATLGILNAFLVDQAEDLPQRCQQTLQHSRSAKTQADRSASLQVSAM